MIAFQMVRGGYIARATHEERSMFKSLARDVIFILGADVHEQLAMNDADDVDPLAAFEAEMVGIDAKFQAELDGADPDDVDEPLFGNDLPLDDALERLLPDMSEDPNEAAELRSLTEESVAIAKVSHLVAFYRGLDEDSIDPELVEISNDDAATWLAAMNDIRLVLATRLNIDSDEDSEKVYLRAGNFTETDHRTRDDAREIETVDDLVAVLYMMLTWWQESLLIAMRKKELRR